MSSLAPAIVPAACHPWDFNCYQPIYKHYACMELCHVGLCKVAKLFFRQVSLPMEVSKLVNRRSRRLCASLKNKNKTFKSSVWMQAASSVLRLGFPVASSPTAFPGYPSSYGSLVMHGSPHGWRPQALPHSHSCLDIWGSRRNELEWKHSTLLRLSAESVAGGFRYQLSTQLGCQTGSLKAATKQ